jgi:hypothetical protein
VVEAAKLWMTMVAEQGGKVVLIDAPDRVNPRKLLKTTGAAEDPGVLTLEEVGELLDHARSCGLKPLWSGGNSAEQAFELGRLGVFGIFTTGSTAKVVPVSGVLTTDQQLAQTHEPTELGVRRVHALLQAGFLCHALSDEAAVKDLDNLAAGLIAAGNDSAECVTALEQMNGALERAWMQHWASGPT